MSDLESGRFLCQKSQKGRVVLEQCDTTASSGVGNGSWDYH